MFGAFSLSPSRRLLECEGREVRLIPRYFDLLRVLVEHRDRVVHRQEIFDRVWPDVVVSDGALTQAVRTLRRALGDDPRDVRFIRTVSRYGYQFVFPVEVAGEGAEAVGRATKPRATGEAAIDALLARLTTAGAEEDQRDAAEQIHALGVDRALPMLEGQPRAAYARALLRDARWDVPGAGHVPLFGQRGWLSSAAALVGLRLRRAARLVGRRWVAASCGGAIAGGAAGIAGGIVLAATSRTPDAVRLVTAVGVTGAFAGGIGAAGVGAGVVAAEALARSRRSLALVLCGAAAGWATGALARGIARAVLAGLFGHDVPGIGGGFEGLVLGAAAGFGYALATRQVEGGGMASPAGAARGAAVLTTAAACAAAGIVITVAGGHLVAASLDAIAARFDGSGVGLGPLARAVGGLYAGPLGLRLVPGIEGLLFGAGLSAGLTHRRRRAASPPAI